MIDDTVHLVHEALDAGQWVLFEGAQATFLDLDHGTYPFVTSSNPVAGGVCTGAGVGPRRIERVIGVVKAYIDASRQRAVPDRAARGRRGRRRARRAWPRVRHQHRSPPPPGLARPRDAEARGPSQHLHRARDHQARRARRRSTSSRCASPTRTRRARATTTCPYHQSVLHKVRPVYETLPGWQPTSSAPSTSRTCRAARTTCEFIEQYTGVHVSFVSVGPARDQTRRAPRAATCRERPRRRIGRARARARVGAHALHRSSTRSSRRRATPASADFGNLGGLAVGRPTQSSRSILPKEGMRGAPAFVRMRARSNRRIEEDFHERLFIQPIERVGRRRRDRRPEHRPRRGPAATARQRVRLVGRRRHRHRPPRRPARRADRHRLARRRDRRGDAGGPRPDDRRGRAARRGQAA